MIKKFPKKAKLIADGDFYTIIKLDKFLSQIHYPIMRKVQINTPELDLSETMHFMLSFNFLRVYKGYAEYRQVDAIKIT